MLNLHSILVAADFSACSEDAFRVARALARDYKARLIVVHVINPTAFVTPGGLLEEMEPSAEYRADLEHRLHLIYTAESPEEVEYRLVEGEPASELLAAARETHSDVIVMGTHGRTGLGRLMMGSVAEQVLRKAACPVLTVKLPLMSSLVEEPAAAEPTLTR